VRILWIFLAQDDFVMETPIVCFADDVDNLFENGENDQAKLSPIVPAKFSDLIEKCGFQMEAIPPQSPSIKA